MIDTVLIMEKFNDYVFSYGPRVLLAILTLLIGSIVIKFVVRGIKKTLAARKVEETLSIFLRRLIRTLLKVILIIAVIGILGVETASFVAVLAALGFAIGFALQGSLANFAAGVLIIATKPYVKGEVIESQGHVGVVDSVDILATRLKAPDGRIILLPNGAVFNNPIININREKQLRVDLVFGVGYESDTKKVQKVIESVVTKHPLVLKDPAPFIKMSALSDSSIDFTVRAWAKKEDRWTVHFDLLEQVKAAFDKEKISIPFPQMDVHMKK